MLKKELLDQETAIALPPRELLKRVRIRIDQRSHGSHRNACNGRQPSACVTSQNNDLRARLSQD